ncbi:hypothetical protein [Arthrobacter monumenti]
MDHKLRVTVRVDIDQSTVCLEVGGCLTASSCTSLLPLIRRAHALKDGLMVTVDLSAAHHIEPAGLDRLHAFAAGQAVDNDPWRVRGFDGNVSVIAPPVLLGCPVSHAGHKLAA